MKRPFLGVFGHTAIDVILQVDEMPVANTSTPVNGKEIKYGGTGANIAKAAADLDVPVRLASFVGGDFPEDFNKNLQDAGVDLSDMMVSEEQRTPTCWIISDQEQGQMALIDQGAMAYLGEMPVPLDTVNNCDIIHIGTGSPEYYQRVMKAASDRTIVFDPAQELRYVYTPEIFKNMLKMSDYFFCNQGEYEIALEYIGGNEPEDVLDHIDVLIVTRGKEGSILYAEGCIENIPAYTPNKVVDPTGAGDAYRSGFYAGLYRNLSLKECCKAASARASFAVEYPGPQEGCVTWDMVLKRMRK